MRNRAAIAPAGHALLRLQRTAGNAAVVSLLSAARGNSLVRRNNNGNTRYAPYRRATETDHWRNPRNDEDHIDAQRALYGADQDGSISAKLYNKHKGAGKGGKCVTTFRTTDDRYLVVVTYADLGSGLLRYDTAFLTRRPSDSPDAAITYHPDTPILPV